jgi:hypothetical protein
MTPIIACEMDLFVQFLRSLVMSSLGKLCNWSYVHCHFVRSVSLANILSSVLWIVVDNWRSLIPCMVHNLYAPKYFRQASKYAIETPGSVGRAVIHIVPRVAKMILSSCSEEQEEKAASQWRPENSLLRSSTFQFHPSRFPTKMCFGRRCAGWRGDDHATLESNVSVRICAIHDNRQKFGCISKFKKDNLLDWWCVNNPATDENIYIDGCRDYLPPITSRPSKHCAVSLHV